MSGLQPDLTTVDVAKVLGCSRQHVTGLCLSGALAAYQLNAGGPWRIRPEDLAQYRQRLVDEAQARANERMAGFERVPDGAEVRRLVDATGLSVPSRLESSRRRRRRVGVL